MPATQQGIGMFRHGSRSFSPAVHGRLRGVRRESHRVIRSAAKTAMSHARTSLSIPDNFLFFVPLKGVLKKVTAFQA